MALIGYCLLMLLHAEPLMKSKRIIGSRSQIVDAMGMGTV